MASAAPKRKNRAYCHQHRLRPFYVWESIDGAQDYMRFLCRSKNEAILAFIESMGVPHHDGTVYVSSTNPDSWGHEVEWEGSTTGFARFDVKPHKKDT